MRVVTIDGLIKAFDKKVAGEVQDKSWVATPVVTDMDVKTHVALASVDVVDGKALFIGGGKREMTIDELEDRLHELEIEHGDAECYTKFMDGDFLVPIYDMFVDGRDGGATFRGDYSDFDKNDKRVSSWVIFKSPYMTKTDAVKAMYHVMAPMGMKFDCPQSAIMFRKVSPKESEVSAKVSGTATALYDFNNHSYFLPDKMSYLAARIKW